MTDNVNSDIHVKVSETETIIEMGQEHDKTNINNMTGISNNLEIIPEITINEKPSKENDSSQNINRHFFEAIQAGDIKEVSQLLQNKTYTPFNYLDEEGYTCLHRATFLNLTNIIELIISQINFQMKEKELISDFINKPANNGSRAIHFASYRGNIEIIQLLIKNQADIHLINNRGLNVIHMAAQGDQPGPLVLFREKYNMNIEAVDNVGNSALHWACYLGSEVFFQFILSYSDQLNLNLQDNQGLAPLHLAVISEKSKLIKKLLHKGADRHIRDKKMRTPLQLAIEKNKLTIVDMLHEEQGLLSSLQCVVKHNLEKTERSSSNMIVFIILHLLIQTGTFFFIIVHFNWLFMSVAYLSNFVLVLLFFTFLSCSNPGYLGYNLLNYDVNIYPRKLLLELIERNNIIDDFCPYCIIKKDEVNKVKHCYYCNRCIKDFDHHCYWVNNCIGKNNINFFFIFITSVMINLFLQMFVGFKGIFMNHEDYLGMIQNNTFSIINPNLKDTTNINQFSFPPYLKFFSDLHFYDKDIKIILCSLLIIISFCFIMPVIYLWIKNIKILFLRYKKNKKEYPKKLNETIIERVNEFESDEEKLLQK